MPEIRPERIISCSGEDKSFPAENLLKVSAFTKWKCEAAGAKQAVVTFKFDRDYQFERIDIGNEGSAFVEVLVSRSSSDESSFQVLLPSSSFMSPADAKNATSLNRVRIFSGDELVKSIAKQKWDVVKVVCIQPFNKSIQFGLSFIRFYHVKEEVETAENSQSDTTAVTSLATELLAANDEEILKPGGLFNVSRKSSVEESPTLSQKLLQQNTSDLKKQIIVLSTGDNNPHRTPIQSSHAPNSSAAHGTETSSSVEPATSNERRKPILAGVVVAFSGYQNPFRSELRTLCLRLGAKYRPDWDDQCTHLICACPNTPKFRLVRGNGIIISHKWIQACDDANRKVSWRPYRVGRAPSPVGHVSDENDNAKEADSDWEDSVDAGEEEDEWKPGNSDVENEDDEDSVSADSTASIEEEENEEPSEEENSFDDEKGGHRRLAGPRVKSSKKETRKSSSLTKQKRKRDQTVSSKGGGGSWEPVRRKRKTSDEPAKASAGASEDTDETVNGAGYQNDAPLPELPDIFPGKTFFIFTKDLSDKEEAVLRRLIIAFAGKIENYMSKDVNFIIARVSWCDDFDDALNVNQNVVFVKPEWIYACDKAAKFVPYQRFQIID